jgi:2-polyprenyl-3-methyl-5-hydroxy-6-metoxy-1,4-benzoquinol methylase
VIERTCVACGAETKITSIPWAMVCRGCGTWRSSLEPSINGDTLHNADPCARELGLRAIRQRTFDEVLDRIESIRPLAGARLLDIGCAHGWFLGAAAHRGAITRGIEPDAQMVAFAAAQGQTVSEGLFPQALAPGERFDVIAFNDVLEHIPDVGGALDACYQHLEPGGLLSVNIPTSDGVSYRVAVQLARCRLRGPLMRLWQHGLPSPHIHYFPRAALLHLLEDRGFRIRALGPVTAIVRPGLWRRLHVYKGPTPATVGGYATLMLAAPVLNARSFCDIFHVVADR